MLRSFSSVRFYLICFAALALGLPMAFISAANLLLVLSALLLLPLGWFQHEIRPVLTASKVSPVILLMLALMAVSSLWSTGSTEQVLTALTKHGRLLLIPILLTLTRSRHEALIAVAFFIGGQVFLLLSSWLQFVGVPVPWKISSEIGICDACSFAIFSSYLDQSIMTAVLAAVSWQFRTYTTGLYHDLLTWVIPGLALACVFFIFQGRTGHIVAIILITLAIAWELPKRLRYHSVLIALALLAALAVGSSKFSQGLNEIGNGIRTFSTSGQLMSSSGMRLDLWHRSLQSLEASPWWGTGVGSWGREFKRQEEIHSREIPVSSATSQHQNPHQEYLLWGVELGLPGIAVLCAVLLALYRDSLRLEIPVRRAMQSVLAALTVSCLFNCALYDAMIGDFFCITLALLLATGIPMPANTLSQRSAV